MKISDAIGGGQLISLSRYIYLSPNVAYDRGTVDPGLRLTDLILVLRRSPEQQAAFDAFVASQYDPGSPNFHHWLTPVDVATRFGPSAADVERVSNWLFSMGLSVDAVGPDRITLQFSGTAGQVEAAFHTSIHKLSVNGEAHIANITDPRIPAALAPVVLGVRALHNFLTRPQHRLGSLVKLNPATGRWERLASSGAEKAIRDGIGPDLRITIGTGSSAHTIEDVAPFDFATIYSVSPLWNAATPIDGAGQTIGIAGTSDIDLSDVASFRKIFGLPAGKTPKIVVANSACLQWGQSRRRRTQKARSDTASRGRSVRCTNAASCCRKARFSKRRFLRDERNFVSKTSNSFNARSMRPL